MMNSATLISVTPDAENHIAYCARVSNPANQDNTNYAGLLKYCIKHQHWSIFEQAFMTLEITTSRGIAAQVLRHRSFTFQEFSQRYSTTNVFDTAIPIPDLRRQDLKNRQNSIDDLEPEVVEKLQRQMNTLFSSAMSLYDQMLEHGVAKECARFVLPLATKTKLYMSGSLRSWITYIALREKHGTQYEHMLIAQSCKSLFCEQFPVIAEALGGYDTPWEL
jgi:thymidylate synthase (FAD)